MSSEWKNCRLGDVVNLKRGYDLPRQNRKEGNVPIVSSSGVSDFHSTPMVQAPGVVTGRYGTIGNVYYIDQDFFPLNTTLYVQDFKGNDPRFVSYFLKTIDFWSCSDKAAVPGVNRNHLHELSANIPPISEQKAVAHILGTLDDKIELNRKTNETLEGIAKALFKSWFVDFEPVRAKAEGRPTGLPDEISELFPDSFEDSELGEIPSGWTVDSFINQFNVLGGGTPKTSVEEFWDGDLPWFSVVDAPNDSDCWVVSTQKTITSSGLKNCSSDLFRQGTTIISARGTVGKVCLVGRPMAMNQSCYALQSKRGQQDIYCYYSTKEIVEILKARAHGSVFSTITRDTLHGVNVCLPDPVVIDAYEGLSRPLLEKIKLHVNESATICSIRDVLLPRLISGELRVADAEKFLEEAGI
jgi:type I restriction enzyme S subunit